jgi:hypothetical protein
MCDKACGKPCYPYMLAKSSWEDIMLGYKIFDSHTGYLWGVEEDKFIKYNKSNGKRV